MIDVGLSDVVSITVTGEDTAIAIGSGDVAVLGTPRVVALCEQASVAALSGLLPQGSTSVGTSISLDHTAASGVGANVTAKATVTGIEGKKVEFAVELVEGPKIAATGTHIRFIVDRTRFERSVEGLTQEP
jgi:predicted thioesterase